MAEPVPATTSPSSAVPAPVVGTAPVASAAPVAVAASAPVQVASAPEAPKPAQDKKPQTQQIQPQQSSMDMTLLIGIVAVIAIVGALFGAMKIRKKK